MGRGASGETDVPRILWPPVSPPLDAGGFGGLALRTGRVIAGGNDSFGVTHVPTDAQHLYSPVTHARPCGLGPHDITSP